MFTADLKKEFVDLIDRIDDEEQLRSFFDLISNQVQVLSESPPPEAVERYERVLNEIRTGTRVFYSNEQVQAEAKEWLKRKSA